jgi:phage baseplate assembly protein gpV
MLQVNIYASDIVIIDNLAWQNTVESKELRKNWKASKKYCKNLRLGNYDDWKLPSIQQLQSLVDLEKYRPSIQDEITQISVLTFYWSDTAFADSKKKAWHVFYKFGESYYSNKGEKYGVRCVRDINSK